MITDTHTEYTYTQREDYIERKPNSCRANKNKAQTGNEACRDEY